MPDLGVPCPLSDIRRNLAPLQPHSKFGQGDPPKNCFVFLQISAFHDPYQTGISAEIRPNSNPIPNLDRDILIVFVVFFKSPCSIAPTRQGDPPKFGCAPAQIQIWTRRSAVFFVCSSDLGVHSSAPNREILRNVAPPQPHYKFGQGEPPNKTNREGDPLLKQLPTHRIVVLLQPPISRMLPCSSRMFIALFVVRLCVLLLVCVSD